MRHPEHDGPTIGLLLCRQKNAVVVEYALRDSAKPIGVADWLLNAELPEDLRDKLPSRDDIERIWPAEESAAGEIIDTAQEVTAEEDEPAG